eukprot:922102-Prorocentrum_minimum.AAC.1
MSRTDRTRYMTPKECAKAKLKSWGGGNIRLLPPGELASRGHADGGGVHLTAAGYYNNSVVSSHRRQGVVRVARGERCAGGGGARGGEWTLVPSRERQGSQ